MTTEIIDRGDAFTPTEDVEAVLGLEPEAVVIDETPVAPVVIDEPEVAPVVVEPVVPAVVVAEPVVPAVVAPVVPPVVAEPDTSKSPRIPKERFDQVNNKRKEAEARTVALEAELAALKKPPVAPAVNLDALEKDYMLAVLDGDETKALALRTQIRTAERAEIQSEAALQAAKTAQTAVVARDVDQHIGDIVTETEVKFAEFDDASELFNAALVEETLELQKAFLADGMTGDAALQKALTFTTRGLTDRSATTAAPVVVAPVVAEPAAPVVVAPVVPALTPKKPDIAAKLAAAAAQPAAVIGGESNGAKANAAPKIADMTDEQYDALPESKKRELRGD